MSDTRLRWLMVVTLTCGIVLGVLPKTAQACSCAGAGPAEMLATHDAAFIGQLVSRRGGLLGGDATWTFQVTQEVKGSFAPTVKISSPSSGAACGFELEKGQEAAIFVRVDGQRLHSGLCSTLDADALRAHLNPQPVVSTRATLLVASGDGGAGRHLWLFDDRGRLANTSTDGRGEWLDDLTICPRGTTLAELWEGQVVVRDVRTLKALRTQRVPRTVGRIWCRDADGGDILAARRNRATGDWDSVVSLRAPRRPVVSGDWIDLEVVDDHLVAAVGREHTQLRRISLATGDQSLLHTARDRPGATTHIPAGIEGFAISPDGARVAFEVTSYPDSGTPSSDVFVYELSTGRRVAVTRVTAEGTEVRWADDNSVVFTSYEEEPRLLGASDLRPRASLPAGVHWAQLQGPDSTLLGMDGPRLASVDVTTGRVRTLATIPAEYSSRLLRLPRPLKVRPDPAQREPTAPPVAGGGDVAAPSELRGGGRSLPATAALAAAAALLLLTALLLLRSRRRGR